MKKIGIILFTVFSSYASAQVFSNKPVGKQGRMLKDSSKTIEYPYILPIWGEKIAKMGIQLPYSAGLSLNYFSQESQLIANNLIIGFNGGQMFDMDEVVRFNSVVSKATSINVRPDVWILPFLNVYGIFGVARSSTTIDAGFYVPDTLNQWNEVMKFNTTANFDATSLGFGLTPTMGVAGGWMAIDMNVAWTDVSALENPVFTFIVGPRFGKSFNLKKPESSINFWVGGFMVNFSSNTKGQVNMAEVFNSDDLQTKIDNGIIKVDQAKTDLDTWWSGLSALEKLNPENIAKNVIANKVINTTSGFLVSADGALSTISNSTVQYALEKSLESRWNFLVGTQYQYNRHWMIRTEVGFLGSRKQGLLSLQYRFGL